MNKERRGEGVTFASPSITCTDAQEQPIRISSSDMKGSAKPNVSLP